MFLTSILRMPLDMFTTGSEHSCHVSVGTIALKFLSDIEDDETLVA